MNLYDLSKQQQALDALINEYAEANDGDISDIAPLIDDWTKEISIDSKIESICYLIKQSGALAEARKIAGNELLKSAKIAEEKSEKLKNWLKYCLESNDKEKINAGIFDVSIRTAGTASFVLHDGVSLANTPLKYIKTTHAIDLAKIKEDARIGISEAFELGAFAPKTKFVSIK